MDTKRSGESAGAETLANKWWILVVRGVAALVCGVLAFTLPGITLFALVLVWGAYALVDGAFGLVLGLRSARSGQRWGGLVFAGIVGMAAGVLTFIWPGVTALALLCVVAAWALLTGVAQIVSAIRLRRQIRGEWLLALSGVLSIAFAVLLVVYPGAGLLTLVWLVGAYEIAFGVLQLALAVRLNGFRKGTQRHVPLGETPTPA
jgi:uncharacterized membrane protein HdeD (DUF308 family)